MPKHRCGFREPCLFLPLFSCERATPAEAGTLRRDAHKSVRSSVRRADAVSALRRCQPHQGAHFLSYHPFHRPVKRVAREFVSNSDNSVRAGGAAGKVPWPARTTSITITHASTLVNTPANLLSDRRGNSGDDTACAWWRCSPRPGTPPHHMPAITPMSTVRAFRHKVS
jgi:hypothetical protein